MTLQEKREELETALIEKAASNSGFRTAVLTDPKGTIQKQFGLSFADQCRVYVHEETPTEFHVVLPIQLQGDLSDDALESVAGGVATIASLQISPTTLLIGPVAAPTNLNSGSLQVTGVQTVVQGGAVPTLTPTTSNLPAPPTTNIQGIPTLGPQTFGKAPGATPPSNNQIPGPTAVLQVSTSSK
jgi:hypothetical protein